MEVWRILLIYLIVHLGTLNVVYADVSKLPPAILQKYKELEGKYGHSIGATISQCAKEGALVYAVVGSGGFTAETFVYDLNGKQLSQAFFSDDGTGTKGSIDLRQYQCTNLKQSQGAIKRP